MNRLGIDPEKYKNLECSDGKFSFVLINPPSEFFLKNGDIVYLLKPGSPLPKSAYKITDTNNNNITNNNETAFSAAITKKPTQLNFDDDSLIHTSDENTFKEIQENCRDSKRNSYSNVSSSLKQSVFSKTPPKSSPLLCSTNETNACKTSTASSSTSTSLGKKLKTSSMNHLEAYELPETEASFN